MTRCISHLPETSKLTLITRLSQRLSEDKRRQITAVMPKLSTLSSFATSSRAPTVATPIPLQSPSGRGHSTEHHLFSYRVQLVQAQPREHRCQPPQSTAPKSSSRSYARAPDSLQQSHYSLRHTIPSLPRQRSAACKLSTFLPPC